MRSRSSPAWRVAGLAPLALLLVTSFSPAPAAATGVERRPVADTWFQTIRFADGSSARITLSTRPTEPASGEGVDLGTVDATNGPVRAGARLAPEDAEAVVPADRRTIRTAGGGTGSQTAWGWVRYTSWAGVELWKWVHQISWSYSAYKVRSIYNQIAASLSSCCLWEYHGPMSVSHSPAGGANFTAFAQGKYKACITSILCESAAPWVWLQGNGNGILTGFSWGVG